MHVFKAIIVAFSMYSKIPMPQIKWNDKNMRYSLCFFPLVGVVIGGLLILWHFLCELLGFNTIIFAAIATFIPILVTGGIHMDGFCDTVDALSSYQPTQKKLEIMKDPTCGAFAVIKTVLYFIITFALYTQVDINGIYIISIGFVLERALSGMSIVTFKKATGSGLASTFSSNANKVKVAITLIIYALICGVSMSYIDVKTGLFAIVFALIAFIYNKIIAYKNFGGITGDVAGYFLQICEIFILASTIISKGVVILWN